MLRTVLPEAADLVANMAVRFRLPDALRRVDALARGRQRPADGHADNHRAG